MIRTSPCRNLLTKCRQSTTTRDSSRRWKSSAAFADYVRDLVKEKVLDEAAKPNSKLWTERESLPRSNLSQRLQSAAPGGGQFKLQNASQHTQQATASFDPEFPASSMERANADIDEPTTNHYMLHDSLQEWFLDSTPTGLLHSLPQNVQTLQDGADPFQLAQTEIQLVTEGIRRDLIGTDHPVLNKAAAYFFDDEAGGKKVRPVMVMLLSKAMAASSTTSISEERSEHILLSQRRLAQISEMIHTASLFHDDVIDNADTRRNKPAVHRAFGDKMAILAGDYLLARASIYLARLRDVEVVETMSTIIEHLVRGEVMQMKQPATTTSPLLSQPSSVAPQMEYYLRKNFYKTASLMANSCKSAAILGQHNPETIQAAYLYGKHVGLAFQLADDIMDFDVDNAALMGKPALSDLKSGLATAPILFAAEDFPQLQTLIQRKFREEGDVEEAIHFMEQSRGMERSKELAEVHSEFAIQAVLQLDASLYRDSLVHLACKVVNRSR
jgi:solanesyl diphosphate synthase